MTELLDIMGAAKLLSLDSDGVLELIEKGILPGIRHPRYPVTVEKSAVLSYLASRREPDGNR